jgi:hypothetical protein
VGILGGEVLEEQSVRGEKQSVRASTEAERFLRMAASTTRAQAVVGRVGF